MAGSVGNSHFQTVLLEAGNRIQKRASLLTSTSVHPFLRGTRAGPQVLFSLKHLPNWPHICSTLVIKFQKPSLSWKGSPQLPSASPIHWAFGLNSVLPCGDPFKEDTGFRVESWKEVDRIEKRIWAASLYFNDFLWVLILIWAAAALAAAVAGPDNWRPPPGWWPPPLPSSWMATMLEFSTWKF